MKIGDEIMHNCRLKRITDIGEGWVETIYCEPNDKGWSKVEKVWLSDLYYTIQLKISEYYKLNDDQLNDLLQGE
jgi:hypothetical protein